MILMSSCIQMLIQNHLIKTKTNVLASLSPLSVWWISSSPCSKAHSHWRTVLLHESQSWNILKHWSKSWKYLWRKMKGNQQQKKLPWEGGGHNKETTTMLSKQWQPLLHTAGVIWFQQMARSIEFWTKENWCTCGTCNWGCSRKSWDWVTLSKSEGCTKSLNDNIWCLLLFHILTRRGTEKVRSLGMIKDENKPVQQWYCRKHTGKLEQTASTDKLMYLLEMTL